MSKQTQEPALNPEFEAWVFTDEEELPADHRSGFIAVVGRPNVGKSTLMNAILGQKIAIVSSRPQTTRNRISGVFTQETMQMVFVDTPGIHQPKHKLGEFMVEEALDSIPDADIILWVVDVAKMPRADDERVAAVLRSQDLAVVLAMNKIDLAPAAALLKHSEAYRALAPAAVSDIAISALKDLGLEALLETLQQQLPLGPRYFPPEQVTDIQERFLAAELIREKVLQNLRQEVPHAVAVDVQAFEERANGKVYIAARIFVERDSQKGILLGKGGSMLKRIGSEARKEIEVELDAPVYLDLHVKVKPRWRRDDAELRRLGYA
ncbi:MAG: GTPase Era [Chloroflexi bacterium]|nr:GTPase Era [Chloroflexota bacterium]